MVIRVLDDASASRLDRLMGLAADGLGGDVGTAVFCGQPPDEMVLAASRGPASEARTPAGPVLAAPVREHSQGILIEDAGDAREAAATELSRQGIRFYAAYPLCDAAGYVIGALIVYGPYPRAPDVSKRSFLERLTALVRDGLLAALGSEAEPRQGSSEPGDHALSGDNRDPVFVLDGKARLKSGNESLMALTGYTETELREVEWTEIIPAGEHAQAMARFNRAVAGETQGLRVRLLRRDGDSRDVAVTIAPQWQDGAVVEVVGVARDITGAVTTGARLDLALESSGQGVWEWEAASDCVYRSSHLRHILGVAGGPAWVDTGDWLGALHPSDQDSFRALVDARGDRQETISQGEWRLACGCEGYRWFQWHARVHSRCSDGRPARVLGTVADIQNLKLAEHRRLREAGRMALAVRAGGAGSFELELNRQQLHCDARMGNHLGLTETDRPVSTESFIARFHADDQDDLRAGLQSLADDRDSLDQERRLTGLEGNTRYLRLLAQRMDAPDGSPLVVGTCWDVTESRQMEAKLAYQARHDALTGLANRYEFERELEEAQQRVNQNGSCCAVGFIDLDRFKIVNDTAGHGAGDELLRQLGDYLSRSLRATDTLARLGGDEFGVVIPDCSSMDAQRRLENLLAGLKTWQFQSQDRIFEVSASAGVAALEPANTVATAMSHADVACYAAKMRGRGSVAGYEAGDSEAGQHHQELKFAADIRSALSADRFELYGQLIEPCHPEPGDTEGFIELLVRMFSADGALVSPGLFIPAAERYELMVAVDQWVVRNALLGDWHEFAVREGVRLSINLSAQSINDPDFLAFVLDLIDRSRLPPDRINFEITETAVMTHLSNARVVVDELRQCGCTVALDDFGSGLSSFNYLRHFNVDFVKIDGGFVREIVSSEPDRIIVESINDLAHRLGARTIAEFVTDEAVLDSIRAIRVDYAQGFALGKPEPLQTYQGIWPETEGMAEAARHD